MPTFSAQAQLATVLLPSTTVEYPDSLRDFSTQIKQEFIQGSAIVPALFETAVHLCHDLETDAIGDVEAPIHDALNWHYTRFGQRAREPLQAALLLNEDGSCWQAKLRCPLMDSSKGKPRKYETPKGNGSRAFLLSVPGDIRARIRDRYGITVPSSGSFWDWLADHPEVPIVLTEGGKKALSLLSLGYVAIALYGVNGGYRKQLDETRRLIPDLDRFAVPGRSITLAFDQDAEIKTRARVNGALLRFGALLTQANCTVKIALWDGHNGKGIDDLVVGCGSAAVETAIAEATPFEHFGILLRLQGRLTHQAAIKTETHDLSTLTIANLPESGIVALSSPKGTGKTKFIADRVQDSDKTLAGGHRIALMRNLSERLGLTYRGDADKANGQFINGAGYTLRVGFCVDSLLAIDPEKFRGCDLVLDEVVQVVRHLLTSSTCGKDGKRPALLARFRALIQSAQRVIVADADLDDATLHYIHSLRDDRRSVFLIKNAVQSQGYAVKFIDAPNYSNVIRQLLKDLSTLAADQVIYLATDSKGTSKAIARLVASAYPGKFPILLINSETSGCDVERSFVQNPHTGLPQGIRLIIASPTVATGISDETQGRYQKVYGIFTGVSSTDADMAQALGRVREPVERVVWCAKTGRNFSTISRSSNALELKRHLLDKTSTIVSLTRSSLREDVTGSIAAIDWQADPHINLWAGIEADRNHAMHNLREALLVRLRFEGNRVTVEERQVCPLIKKLLTTARAELKEIDAESLVSAKILTLEQVLELSAKEATDLEDQQAIARYWLCDFYAIEPDALTVDWALADREGRRRGELLNLEAQLFPGVALDQTARSLEKQMRWNAHICPWDIPGTELRRALRALLGLNQFLKPEAEWTQVDLEAFASKARELSSQVKLGLHLTLSDRMSDTQIVHQLLSQMGVKVAFRWAGGRANRHRVYSLDSAHWQRMMEILTRRAQRRLALQQVAPAGVITHSVIEEKPVGDHSVNPLTYVDLEAQQFAPEVLAEAQSLWEAADTPEAIAFLKQLIPPEVLERAIA